MPRLTKRLIDTLKPQEGRDRFVWDSELRGYGLRMKPSGAASYLVQYRTPQAQTRRLAFARLGTLTPEEARGKARRLLAAARDGRDPSFERHEAREALTVAHLCELYMEAARKGLVTTRFGRPKRASTAAIDEGRISRHIVPLIGRCVANKLTRADLQRMVDAIAAGKTAAVIKTTLGKAVVTGGHGAARRVAGLFGGIWTWGAKRGFVDGINPARGLELRADKAKDRTLSKAELTALGQAARHYAQRDLLATAALELMALTGLRRGEAYGLRWQEIDWEGQCLRLQETKAGRSTRPIGREALDLLRSIPRVHDVFVFPSRDGSKSADLQGQIAAIFDAAGLRDARGHDLRRTFASIAAELGYADSTISELLGHARRGVTARHYIRRPDVVLVSAADRIAQVIARAMRGEDADIVSLPAERDRQ